jgi:hypothetical protein
MHIPAGIRSSSRRHVIRVAQSRRGLLDTILRAPLCRLLGPLRVRLSTSVKVIDRIPGCNWGHLYWVRDILKLTIGADTEVSPAFVAWRVRASWKRKKARTVPARLSMVYKTSAKPTLVSLVDTGKCRRVPARLSWQPPVPSTPVEWATQVRCVRLPPGVTVPPVAVTAPSRSPQHHG